ncbi:3-oxoacyl-(acyl-carrier-protein) synthase [Sulfurospirillum barnesii SES-3]|uniref:3-oxoacyl-(Acyl-carrier-protein) synthase n=2 Tax=Sulfurospirillum barnesii TaxID=44674 RepID=I3Y013_SULBS|nr:3-oxoacyl-(acyl-carrier-protein) synthase [Sulfurospirillum barnesii SES-3]
MQPNSVFITAFESVCCAGLNSESLFEAICTHQSGIGSYDGYVKDKTVALGKVPSRVSLETLLHRVCETVRIQRGIEDFYDTLLVVGSSVGGMQRTEEIFFRDHSYAQVDPKRHIIHTIASSLHEVYGFKDDISFSTACTSSANALGYAYEVIQKGVYQRALVVGFDTLSSTTVLGFDALGVLSTQACCPFDEKRQGMNVSEGIAVLLLENEPVQGCVQLKGVGYSSDAHHMAQPSAHGEGAIKAMQNALECEGVLPHEVDYINAHGTGTLANDHSEACAIEALFGSRPFVSSTKSITGHTLGAAGALEAIICVLALQKQVLPPNTFLKTPENSTLRFVYELLSHPLRYVLSNSLAFGGNNISLLFGVFDEG